jgi:hypothetical protein
VKHGAMEARRRKPGVEKVSSSSSSCRGGGGGGGHELEKRVKGKGGRAL